jgi:hypothetical protein
MGESGDQSATPGADSGDKKPATRQTTNGNLIGADATILIDQTNRSGKKAEMKPPSTFLKRSLLAAVTTSKVSYMMS